jgi:acetyl-CoA carboxylase biotin carboxyl carrier protein
MDLKNIRQLIKMVESSEISEFELEEDGKRLKISKAAPVVNAAHMPPQVFQASPPPATTPTIVETPAHTPHETVASEAKNENLFEVRSPMVGTFYTASSPDAPPYVQVGDSVSAGQTLCIVEAMKLMNEIEAETAGKISKILVENAQPVEYNQVLFLIEKTA